MWITTDPTYDSRFVHVVPVDDLKEHELNVGCWCHPVIDDEEPSVVVHNAMDLREEYEAGGGRKPS